jgi:hypothetical protein
MRLIKKGKEYISFVFMMIKWLWVDRVPMSNTRSRYYKINKRMCIVGFYDDLMWWLRTNRVPISNTRPKNYEIYQKMHRRILWRSNDQELIEYQCQIQG